MPYTHPKMVTSPKHRLSELDVVYDGGKEEVGKEDGWSLATMQWDNEPAVGIRWNGGEDSGVGNPQSRGLPTWFILPKALAESALRIARKLDKRANGLKPGD